MRLECTETCGGIRRNWGSVQRGSHSCEETVCLRFRCLSSHDSKKSRTLQSVMPVWKYRVCGEMSLISAPLTWYIGIDWKYRFEGKEDRESLSSEYICETRAVNSHCVVQSGSALAEIGKRLGVTAILLLDNSASPSALQVISSPAKSSLMCITIRLNPLRATSSLAPHKPAESPIKPRSGRPFG